MPKTMNWLKLEDRIRQVIYSYATDNCTGDLAVEKIDRIVAEETERGSEIDFVKEASKR